MHRITVLLAEDHAIVREGLKSLLELQNEFRVVAETGSGREAIRQTSRLRPRVVIMDIAMPDLNGFEATRQIMLAAPKTRVLALSAHSDDEYISHMAEVGACGYLLKQSSGETLLRAVRDVANGKSFFSPSVKKRLSENQRKARENGEPGATAQNRLTTREAEVLQLVAEGAANKQAALSLGISIKTVEKHRQRLMDKLNIHDTAGLTRYAIATGVIESSVQATTRTSRSKRSEPIEALKLIPA